MVESFLAHKSREALGILLRIFTLGGPPAKKSFQSRAVPFWELSSVIWEHNLVGKDEGGSPRDSRSSGRRADCVSEEVEPGDDDEMPILLGAAWFSHLGG